MHDFIQSLSFQSQSSPTLARVTLDALRGVMRSFDDETPAYHPGPREGKRPAKRRRNLKSQISNLK
jgi:hypothetical protein